ncbi:molybdenum cofactor guanylyltransferase [Pelosinus sp. sgz500959]|uniref:molybdenum cofactor guanylyltransferase n=1 Tax=Pelosinus sp. sgz500959 TaxID=3242472 RepID=UPI0036707F7F
MKEGCRALEAEKFSVIVLAGGQSRRMGQDKASLSWGEKDVLSSLLARLLPLSDDVVVISNVERTVTSPVRQFPDLIPGKGPLSGIHAGLIHARHDLVFVTACDVPFLIPEIIPHIVHSIGSKDGSVAIYNEQVEPLFACYHKHCSGIVAELLAKEKYRVKDFLTRISWVGVQDLKQYADCCFMNINTPHEYEKAKAILAEGREV